MCPTPADIQVVEIPGTEFQGWYDPWVGDVIPDDHMTYYQYNLTDIPDPFVQHEGEIYWLELCPNSAGGLWGWKSSENHYEDDAVWRIEDYWYHLIEPGSTPITDTFFAAFDPFGYIIPGQSGGSGYNDGEWYYYENTYWYNQWFYDHPYDPERIKVIHIEFDAIETAVGVAELTMAVNWSTAAWSLEGNPPGEPRVPPLPPLTPEDEALYIGRFAVCDLMPGEIEGHHVYDYVIPDFNPEWVSIDLDGDYFELTNGIIIHDCAQSLDLAFVITGEPVSGIPTVTEWGLIVMTLLLLTAGTIIVRKTRKVAAAA